MRAGAEDVPEYQYESCFEYYYKTEKYEQSIWQKSESELLI